MGSANLPCARALHRAAGFLRIERELQCAIGPDNKIGLVHEHSDLDCSALDEVEENSSEEEEDSETQEEEQQLQHQEVKTEDKTSPMKPPSRLHQLRMCPRHGMDWASSASSSAISSPTSHSRLSLSIKADVTVAEHLLVQAIRLGDAFAAETLFQLYDDVDSTSSMYRHGSYLCATRDQRRQLLLPLARLTLAYYQSIGMEESVPLRIEKKLLEYYAPYSQHQPYAQPYAMVSKSSALECLRRIALKGEFSSIANHPLATPSFYSALIESELEGVVHNKEAMSMASPVSPPVSTDKSSTTDKDVQDKDGQEYDDADEAHKEQVLKEEEDSRGTPSEALGQVGV